MRSSKHILILLLFWLSGWGFKPLSAALIYSKEQSKTIYLNIQKSDNQPLIPIKKSHRKPNKIPKRAYYDYGYRYQTTALYLCIFLGLFGAHRFYTGHIWIGILCLLTFGGFGFIWMWDLLMILLGEFKTSKGEPLVPKEHAPKPHHEFN